MKKPPRPANNATFKYNGAAAKKHTTCAASKAKVNIFRRHFVDFLHLLTAILQHTQRCVDNDGKHYPGKTTTHELLIFVALATQTHTHIQRVHRSS